MKHIKLFLIFALVAFSGCVSIKSTLYPGHKYAPIAPSQVEVLEALPKDPATYTVIGEMTVEPAVSYGPIFRSRLKKKAAKLGAHAVFFEEVLDGYLNVSQPATSTTKTSYSGAVSGTNVPGQIPIVSGTRTSQTTYTPATSASIPVYGGHATLLRYNDVEYFLKLT